VETLVFDKALVDLGDIRLGPLKRLRVERVIDGFPMDNPQEASNGDGGPWARHRCFGL
jgi:hypothetical protein